MNPYFKQSPFIKMKRESLEIPYEKSPSETPRTDAAEIGYRDNQRVPAGFARQLEHELNTSQAAIVEAIGNILSRGGDEEWPIIKHLRAALKI
jgi:hypothetical protein